MGSRVPQKFGQWIVQRLVVVGLAIWGQGKEVGAPSKERLESS